MKIKGLIAALSVILLSLLVLVSYIHRLDTPLTSSATDFSTESTQTSSQPMESASSQTTQSSTSTPETQPPTQPPTNPPTQPPTQATTPATKPNTGNPTVDAFVQARMKTWICPLKAAFGDVVGSRTFASSRASGKRAHAGLDFVAPHGTKVYAITSGTVQRVAPFYQNTVAVEVLNDDGSILRYCEIATNLKVGDYLEQGDVIGTILRADSGTEMLHMEVYYGNGEGMLTQTSNKTYKYVDSKNYQRRSDLLDPTFLKDLPKG